MSTLEHQAPIPAPNPPHHRSPQQLQTSGSGSSHWSELEHSKCIKAVEKLVMTSQATHEKEKQSLFSYDKNEEEDGDGLNSTVALSGFYEEMHNSEMRELRLFVEAIKGRDIIGVVSLAGAFWNCKNILQRQKNELEMQITENGENVKGTVDFMKQLMETSATQLELTDLKKKKKEKGGGLEYHRNFQDRMQKHLDVIESQDFVQLSQLSAELHHQLRLYEEEEQGRIETGFDRRRVAKGAGTVRGGKENAAAGSAGLWLQATEKDSGSEAVDTFVRTEIDAGRERLHTIVEELEHLQLLAATENELTRRIHAPIFHQSQLDGSYHIIQLIPYQAKAGESIESVAQSFGVATNGIAVPHTYSRGRVIPDSEAFTTPVTLTIQVTKSLRGLDACLKSLTRRIQLLQEVSEPHCDHAVIAAKEALWDAEVEAMSNPASNKNKNMEDKIKNCRRKLEKAEHDAQRLHETLKQCQSHKKALEQGDLAAISYMLEAKHLESLEGIGSQDRVVYAVREIPPGTSIEDFARDVESSVEEIFVFQEGDITLAYVPTLVPRSSILDLDQALRTEIDDHSRRFPSLPPRTDILEQLNALRRGDCNALCSMLSSARKMGGTKPQSAVMTQDLEDTVTEQERVIRQLESQVNTLQKSNASVDKKLKATENEIQEVRDSWNQEVAELEKSKSEVENKDRTLTNRNVDLQSQVATLEKELSALKDKASNQSSTPNREREALQSRLQNTTQQLQEERAQTGNLNSEIAGLKADVRRFETSLQAKGKEVENTKEEKANAETQIKEMRKQHEAEASENASHIAKIHADLTMVRSDAQKQENRSVEMEKANRELSLQLDELRKKELLRATEVSPRRRQEEVGVSTSPPRLGIDIATSPPGSPSRGTTNDHLALSKELEEAKSKILQLQDEVLKNHRQVYVCREIPSGSSMEDFSKMVGVPIESILPFRDLTNARYYAYYPTVVPRASVQQEDEKLQHEILRITQDEMKKSKREGGAGQYSAPTVKPPIALYEQLSALRAGDCAALSSMLYQMRQQLAGGGGYATTSTAPPMPVMNLSSMLSPEASMLDRTTASTGTTQDSMKPAVEVSSGSDDEEGDEKEDWFDVEVLRNKLKGVKEELERTKKRELKWKTMCDEYKDKGKLHLAQEALARAKVEFEKQVQSKDEQIVTLKQEIIQLNSVVELLTKKKNEQEKKFNATRKELIEERETMVQGIREQMENEQRTHERTIKKLHLQISDKDKALVEYKKALEQMQQQGDDDDDDE